MSDPAPTVVKFNRTNPFRILEAFGLSKGPEESVVGVCGTARAAAAGTGATVFRLGFRGGMMGAATGVVVASSASSDLSEPLYTDNAYIGRCTPWHWSRTGEGDISKVVVTSATTST